MQTKYKDKRGREWELFLDIGYYDLYCVRVVGERDFDSQLSFHFETEEKAIQFAELVSESR